AQGVRRPYDLADVRDGRCGGYAPAGRDAGPSWPLPLCEFWNVHVGGAGDGSGAATPRPTAIRGSGRCRRGTSRRAAEGLRLVERKTHARGNRHADVDGCARTVLTNVATSPQ